MSSLAKQPVSMASSTLKLLENHHWPGNVRELENVIQRIVALSKGTPILPADLPPEITGASTASPVEHSGSGEGAATDVAVLARQLFQWARRDPKRKVMPAVERELVIQAMKECSGNQVQASKLLGITRATLRKRLEKFSIQRELNIT